MNITFLTASLGSGGAERVVSLLANRMAGMGHRVEIVCLKFDDVYYQTREDVKVTIAIRECPGNLLKRLIWLRKHVKSSGTEVCIAFTEGVYCATIAAMLGTRIPVIASERLDPASFSMLRKGLRKVLLPFVDWMVVQTEHIRSTYSTALQRRTSVIFNPVNEKVYSLESSVRDNVVISVARLFPQKNQRMLIKAFAKATVDFSDWKLVIYGEGPLRDSLESMVESLNLKGRVLLPGRSERIIEELNKAGVFALSSDYEGMSNAMIEAVCVGLPVVSTRVSGTESLIKEGKNGFVVDCGDVEAMAIVLRRLMGDEELRKKMGKESKAMADKFRIEVIVEEWLSLIETVVWRSKRASR